MKKKKKIKANKCKPCTLCMYTDEFMTVFKKLKVDDLKILLKSINYNFLVVDPMPTWLLFECFYELPIILSIINKSLSTGIFFLIKTICYKTKY